MQLWLLLMMTVSDSDWYCFTVGNLGLHQRRSCDICMLTNLYGFSMAVYVLTTAKSFLGSLYKYFKENRHHWKTVVEQIPNILSTPFNPWVILTVRPLKGGAT